MTMLISRKGHVVASNRKLRTAVGLLESDSDSGAVGLHINDVFDGQGDDIVADLRSAASGAMVTLRPKTSASLPALYVSSVQMIRAYPGSRRDLILVDVKTDQDSLRAKFIELTDRMDRANRQAAEERRKRRKLARDYDHLERFAQMMAHDLKAPLRGVDNLLLFIEDGYGSRLPDDAAGYLRRARSSTTRLQRLISELLDYSTARTSGSKVEEIDLDDVVGEVRDIHADELQMIDGRLRVNCPLGVIRGDRTLVKMLLQNLIDNSIKYRLDGRPLEITIEAKLRPSTQVPVTLRIVDNGLGLSAEEAKAIFAPFESTDRLQGERSGIGTTTCRVICDRHGWRIGASGVPRQSSMVEITF